MNPSPKILEALIAKFHNGLDKEFVDINEEKNLSKLLSLLLKEVQFSRENENILQKNLQTVLESESSNLTILYTHLKDEHKKSLEEIAKLKQDMEYLSIQNMAEQKNSQIQFEEKLRQTKESLISKIKLLESDLVNERTRHNEKEQELSSQIELIQCARDMQREDMEAHLKQQLVDLNARLRQAQNMIRDLQVRQTLGSTNCQRPDKPQTPQVLQFHNTSTSGINKDALLNSEYNYRQPQIRPHLVSQLHNFNENATRELNSRNSQTKSVTHKAQDHYNLDKEVQSSITVQNKFNNTNLRTAAPTPNQNYLSHQTKSSVHETDEKNTYTGFGRSEKNSVAANNSTSSITTKLVNNSQYHDISRNDVISIGDENSINYNNVVEKNTSRVTSRLQYDQMEADKRNCTRYSKYNGTTEAVQNKRHQKENQLQSKYRPLVENQTTPNAPKVYSKQSYRGSYNKNKDSLPPLISCSTSNGSSAQSKNGHVVANKKRKLYDPDDLHYLDDFEPTPRT